VVAASTWFSQKLHPKPSRNKVQRPILSIESINAMVNHVDVSAVQADNHSDSE